MNRFWHPIIPLALFALTPIAGIVLSEDSTEPPALAALTEEVPAPADNPATPQKVRLGKQLFFDPRLSGDNTMSCATCHLPEKAFVDGRARGKGRDGKELTRNVPSLLNAGLYPSYFWDGRAKSLEEQALAPIESPDEMNQDLDELERELNAVPGYMAQFERAFGTKVTRRSIAKALAAFQRTLVSRNSPFDRYLGGDEDALSSEAQDGMRLFVEADCVRCHKGPHLSDGKFYRLGAEFKDKGRGRITGATEDLYKFRTPSLRDVARTAPYMHDGSRKTLFEVVEFYYRMAPVAGPDGLPLDIQPLLDRSYSEMPALVAFLESLTGEPPKIDPPDLP
jgi:cytochrome c peroxidase